MSAPIIIVDDTDTETDEPIAISLDALRAAAADSTSASSSSASTTPSSTTSASSSSSSSSLGEVVVLRAISRRSDASSRARQRARARRQSQIATVKQRRATAAAKAAKKEAARAKKERVARRRLGALECALCETSDRPDLAGAQFVTTYPFGDVTKDAWEGKLIGPDVHGVPDVHLHESCMVWAPDVYDSNGEWLNVDKELRRSDDPICTCFVCGKLGGVTGCAYGPCKRTAHFPCLLTIARPEDQWFFDYDNFRPYCPDHEPALGGFGALARVVLPSVEEKKAPVLCAFARLVAEAPRHVVAAAEKEEEKEEKQSPSDDRWDRWIELLTEERNKLMDGVQLPRSYHGARQHYPEYVALQRWEQEQPEAVDDWDIGNRERIRNYPKVPQKCPVVANYSSDEEEDSEADEATEDDKEAKAAAPMEEVEVEETPEQKAAAEAARQEILADPLLSPRSKQVIGEDPIFNSRDDDADAFADEFALRMSTQPSSPVWADADE